MCRLERFRQQMSEAGIKSYFVGYISNIFYLTGFTGSTAYLLLTENENILISDGRYAEQIANEVFADVRVEIVNDYQKFLSETVSDIDTLSVDPECDLTLFNVIAGVSTAIVDTDAQIAKMRRIKDADEISQMKVAYDIAGKAFNKMLKQISYGMTENEWAAELEYHMKKLGATSTSFDTIVGSGARGALPHGIASDKIIHPVESVIIDYGCKKSYCSDITRVIFNGKDSFVNEVIDVVFEALQKSIAQVAPGKRCCDIDAVAREHIHQQGFGDYFNHGLGHGVGIDVHENPRFSPRDETVLEPGMVLTVEPGIYLPGRFGIRLEDTVHVTENGCEILSAVLDNHVYTL